jgi:hypothetical protein
MRCRVGKGVDMEIVKDVRRESRNSFRNTLSSQAADY